MSEDPQATEPLYVQTANAVELRDHIFKQKDRKEVLIPVPEWGVEILALSLSGTLRSQFLAFVEALNKHHDGDEEYYKRFWFEAARLGCVHPETKQPIFQAADRDTLMDEHDGVILDMLGQTITKMSNIDGSATRRAKKNLLSIQSSIDIISSPSSSATNA